MGLALTKVACTFWVHPVKAPCCLLCDEQSQVGLVFHALPMCKPLRISAALQEHWQLLAITLCPFQVKTAPFASVGKALSQMSHASFVPLLSQQLGLLAAPEGTVSCVPCVSSGELISGCDSPGLCELFMNSGCHG